MILPKCSVPGRSERSKGFLRLEEKEPTGEELEAALEALQKV